MPSAILYPSAVSSDSANIILVGGVAGLSSDDADTSYAEGNDNAAIERYTIDDLPSMAASITSVDLQWKARYSNVNAANLRAGIYLGGSTTNGTTQTLGSAYAAYSDLGVARPGGGSWLVADVNSSELVIEKITSGADTSSRVTYLWADITYLLGQGFLFWLFSIFGPLVSVTLSDMSRLAADLYRRSGVRLRPDEYMDVLRMLREAPMRSVFDLGVARERAGRC